MPDIWKAILDFYGKLNFWFDILVLRTLLSNCPPFRPNFTYQNVQPLLHKLCKLHSIASPSLSIAHTYILITIKRFY